MRRQRSAIPPQVGVVGQLERDRGVLFHQRHAGAFALTGFVEDIEQLDDLCKRCVHFLYESSA